jgi:hypothetical protein
MLLKQIFLRDGEPIKMHIHPSIANVNARAALAQRIMVCSLISVTLNRFASSMIMVFTDFNDGSILAVTRLPRRSLLESSSQIPILKFLSISSKRIRALLINTSSHICG